MKKIHITEQWVDKRADGTTEKSIATKTDYYDDSDRKVRSVETVCENELKEKHETLYEYDSKGRLIRESGNSLESIHSFREYSDGRVQETTQLHYNGVLYEQTDIRTPNGLLIYSTTSTYDENTDTPRQEPEIRTDSFLEYGKDGKLSKAIYKVLSDGKWETTTVEYSYSKDGAKEITVEKWHESDGRINTTVKTVVKDNRGREIESRSESDGKLDSLWLHTYEPDNDNRWTEHVEIHGVGLDSVINTSYLVEID